MNCIFVLFSLTVCAAGISARAHDHDRGLVVGLTRTPSQRPAIRAAAEDIPAWLRIWRQRSSARFHALKKGARADRQGQKLAQQSLREDAEHAASEPLRGYADGYIMPLRLGTPPQVLQVYMDTGSDLVWVPCLMPSAGLLFNCMNCEDRDYCIDSMFSPLLSYSSLRESCNSTFCADVHSTYNTYDICTMAGCSLRYIVAGFCSQSCPTFSYRYGDGIVSGTLLRDTLDVGILDTDNSDEDVDDDNYFYSQKGAVANFKFGCAGASLSEPIGIAGFGRGSLSVPSQMGAKAFSYCLVSYRFEDNPNVSSPLVVGKSAIPEGEGVQYTPMIYNPIYPNYYYLGLEGISVGSARLGIPRDLSGFDAEGNGGMIIDSGTTYTHLPQTVYRAVLAALRAEIGYQRSEEYEKRTAFDLCYEVASNVSPQHGFPAVSYHFANNVTIVFPAENHFYAMAASKPYSSSLPPFRTNDSVQVHCLALIQTSKDAADGPAAVLGSFQQQNVQVVYDTEGMRIGFQPKDCAASATPK